MAIQFPNNPGIGSVFTDTSAGFSYEWTGVVWKSFTAAAANNIKELDDISSGFNNSTTTFNLAISGVAYEPRNAAMLQISLGGVIQEPNTDYTVSTSTITFSTAPTTGLSFFGIVRGTAVAIDYAANGNVQTKQEFTATAGQSSFTIDNGYTAGFIDVFRNGVRLAADDITTTSGDDIVLTTPAQVGDIIETVKYTVASLVTNAGQFTNLNISGIATAASFVGPLTGTASLASGITGTPNIVVGSVTGSTGTFTGNVSIGGTLTYQDVTNIDSVGIITAQQGIQVLSNGLDITGISTFKSGLTVAGVSTFTSNVVLNANLDLQDDDKILLGTGDDLEIYHDGTNSTITNTTGDLYITDSGGNIYIQSKAGEQSIVAFADGAVDLYHDNSKKLETKSYGIDVTGAIVATGDIKAQTDGGKFMSGASDDLQIYHDGTDGQIVNGSSGGHLNIKSTGGGNDINVTSADDFIVKVNGSEDAIKCTANTSVELYHNGTKKFETSAAGVTVTGAINVSAGSNLNGYKVENGFLSNLGASGTVNTDLSNGHIHKYQGATSGNYGPNFRVDGSTTLSSVLDVGDVVTVTFMAASSSHYLDQTDIQVDGSTSNLDIDFVGGSAPDAANGSGFDIYTFTIQKTAATPAYHIVVNALGAN